MDPDLTSCKQLHADQGAQNYDQSDANGGPSSISSSGNLYGHQIKLPPRPHDEGALQNILEDSS
jgi:hypothetical protein